MADFDFEFEPPSFSLGFDLDSPPRPSCQPAKPLSSTSDQRTIIEEERDCFESPVGASESPRALKRLRRGSANRIPSRARKAELLDGWCNLDDEIEDFSSEEDSPTTGNPHTHSVCSSSKVSLHRQRVLTAKSECESKSRKREEVLCATTSSNVETNHSNLIFPKLTVSPLRRFQLIDSDSDSDGPSLDEDVSKEVNPSNFSLNGNQSNSRQQATLSGQGTTDSSIAKYQTEDLWKEFCSKKSFHIPTPAFDEVCEEYFTSVKDNSEVKNNCNHSDSAKIWDLATQPPALCYFFHEDPRIQKLVRDRLPQFFPLGAGNNLRHNQQNASIIDYMGQFSHEENSKRTNSRCNVKASSSRTEKIAIKSHVGNVSQDATTWVTPKSCAGVPKGTGKRRVHAGTKSAGHWYTGSDGQRVYVNRNGQELTGQTAFRHYRRESGMGYKNSKKAAGKKKTTDKKKSAPKKK